MESANNDDKYLLDTMQAAAAFVLVYQQRQRRRVERSRFVNRYGTTNRYRARKLIETIYNENGPRYFRRAYRMSYEDFQALCRHLQPQLNKLTTSLGQRPWGPNGRIPNSIRLACALRYFAGGAVYDIVGQFGISEPSFYASVAMIVEAVNNCPHFVLRYPSSHDKQQEIAQGFMNKSRAGFARCAGAIDGLLIWINKPSKRQCAIARHGQIKFFCGRKHKYGLNMQAVCDHHCRFLDVSIMYGGAASDLLAFEASDLYGRLKDHALLAPGLCLFDDNAYVNTSFMATPYPGNVDEEKDAYNFYHSQLRITSECSFGRLVLRWGFLQKKTPQHYTLGKTISTMMCLCRLHNYCTDASLARNERLHPPQLIDEDGVTIRLHGGVAPHRQYREEFQRHIFRPAHLLDGGNHNDDVHRQDRRTEQGRQQRGGVRGEILPRELLCDQVTGRRLRRPPVRQNNNNNLVQRQR